MYFTKEEIATICGALLADLMKWHKGAYTADSLVTDSPEKFEAPPKAVKMRQSLVKRFNKELTKTSP